MGFPSNGGVPRTTSPDVRLDRIENDVSAINSRLATADQRQARIEEKLDKLAGAAPSPGGPLAALTGNPKYQWIAFVLAALAGGWSIAQPYVVK